MNDPAYKGEGAISLGLFGKHPAWADHVSIQISADCLTEIRRVLYVQGIADNLNRGVWEALPADKRIDGFHHHFLGLWAEHWVVGRLWASADQVGRGRFPLVVCAVGQGPSLPIMVRQLLPALAELEMVIRPLRRAATSNASSASGK